MKHSHKKQSRKPTTKKQSRKPTTKKQSRKSQKKVRKRKHQSGGDGWFLTGSKVGGQAVRQRYSECPQNGESLWQ